MRARWVILCAVAEKLSRRVTLRGLRSGTAEICNLLRLAVAIMSFPKQSKEFTEEDWKKCYQEWKAHIAQAMASETPLKKWNKLNVSIQPHRAANLR
jgi:hypothetical protein